MNNELLSMLDYIERDRGISRESMIAALESAILSASKKSIHPASTLSVKLDPRSGKIQAWAELEVVEENPGNDQITLEQVQEKFPNAKIGDTITWEVTPKDFGRIAAQHAKQAIAQELRKAEKETVLAQFKDRIGQIITGTVSRVDSNNVIIDFQKADGIMSSKDRIFGEQYVAGDMINVLLVKIDIETAGPSLIVSRSNPNFVKKLFEREVSEIHDGIVEIKGIAREAGNRTKIAVASNDPRVDPVGSCVGMRGTRVKNITNELGSERIDIIPYDENIAKYATNALQPAKVQRVDVREETKEIIVYVNEEQSKIAFGKKAQNVRLCSKLIGWSVNIQTENPLEEKIVEAANKLAFEIGVSVGTANRLVRAGFLTADGIKAAGLEQLLEIEKINVKEVTAAFEKLMQ